MNLSIIALAGLIYDAFGVAGAFTVSTIDDTMTVEIFVRANRIKYSKSIFVDINSKPSYLDVRVAEAIKSIKDAIKKA